MISASPCYKVILSTRGSKNRCWVWILFVFLNHAVYDTISDVLWHLVFSVCLFSFLLLSATQRRYQIAGTERSLFWLASPYWIKQLLKQLQGYVQPIKAIQTSPSTIPFSTFEHVKVGKHRFLFGPRQVRLSGLALPLPFQLHIFIYSE